MHLIDILTIVIAGLMVGNELTVSLFINPVMRKLDAEAQTKALSLFAALLGRVMPVWYGFCLVLFLVETAAHRGEPQFYLLLAASIHLLLVSVNWFAGLSWASYRVPSPPLLLQLAFVGTLVLLSAAVLANKSRVSWSAGFAVLALAPFIAVYVFPPRLDRGRLEVTVIDVGRSATLSSGVLEDPEDVVGRPIAVAAVPRHVRVLEALAHHLDVGFRVAMGRGDLGVSEPCLDRDEVCAGTQQLHRQRMAKQMG